MTTVLLYTILFLNGVLIIWNIVTELRIRRFMRGTNGKSLESSITMVMKKIELIENENQALLKKQFSLEQTQKKAIRNVETVRFNPFADQGSNQSFATAFINEEKNGVIISTLFARDRMSIFAKPIINGISEYELTNEEKTVLQKTLS